MPFVFSCISILLVISMVFRRIVAVEGAVKAMCTRLEIVDLSNRSVLFIKKNITFGKPFKLFYSTTTIGVLNRSYQHLFTI